MNTRTTLEALRDGEITLRELRGISDAEMQSALRAGRTLLDRGESRAAAEVMAGLALYDPFNPDVWRALEDLFRRERRPAQANLFASLARAMTI